MLRHSAQIGALAFFAVVAVVLLGYILWRSLFPAHKPNHNDGGTNEQYAQQQSATKNTQIGSQKSVTDENIAIYTMALAIFTGLLVLVSTFQIGFWISANDTATEAANAAKKSADVAERTLTE